MAPTPLVWPDLDFDLKKDFLGRTTPMAPPDKAAGGGIKTSALELDEAGKLADLIKSGFNSIAFLLSSSTRSSLCKLMDFEMGFSSTL